MNAKPGFLRSEQIHFVHGICHPNYLWMGNSCWILLGEWWCIRPCGENFQQAQQKLVVVTPTSLNITHFRTNISRKLCTFRPTLEKYATIFSSRFFHRGCCFRRSWWWFVATYWLSVSPRKGSKPGSQIWKRVKLQGCLWLIWREPWVSCWSFRGLDV